MFYSKCIAVTKLSADKHKRNDCRMVLALLPNYLPTYHVRFFYSFEIIQISRLLVACMPSQKIIPNGGYINTHKIEFLLSVWDIANVIHTKSVDDPAAAPRRLSA